MLFTLPGVKERRDVTPAAPESFKKIFSTIAGNDQLLWVGLIFLIQSIDNSIATSGVATSYVYFEFGYEGGLYSLFTTVGILMPSGTVKFWVGYMLANFGQYGFYLILMISIFNTVEYNELKHGTRDEAIITSMRPFLTKLSSALVILIAYVSYRVCHVTDYTNQISEFENLAQRGLMTSEAKSSAIVAVLANVSSSQTLGLLLTMTVIPLVLLVIAYVLYRKFYKLDEDTYAEICAKLNEK